MSFEDLMAVVGRWLVATEALAAVGAELNLSPVQGAEPGPQPHPDVLRALRAVSAAAGLAGPGDLPEPQRDMVRGLIRMCLRQAQDLLDDPARAPGWTFTDPAILRGWGLGSMVVPGALAAAAPELADIGSFLDVGTGVGLLAVAAARVWPRAAITGIDVWPPALGQAADTVQRAGLGDRVTIREQDVTALDDAQAYDCAWVPTFFLTEPALDAALPRLFRSLRPGGWLVLGRMVSPPDPLAEAVTALRTVRGGGTDFDAKSLAAALEGAGCTGIRAVPRQGPAPLEYIIGSRPALA